MQFAWALSIASVIYLSLNPRIEFPFKLNNIDKIYHFLAYLWLAAIPFFGFQRLKMALTGACLMIPLGIALEFGQRFVQGRTFAVTDMVANTVGVILGVVLGCYIRPHMRSWEASTSEPGTRGTGDGERREEG